MSKFGLLYENMSHRHQLVGDRRQNHRAISNINVDHIYKAKSLDYEKYMSRRPTFKMMSVRV